MTALVGLALLLVFAIFATLMFLERISTLLALPLMATLFLAIALAADCWIGTPPPPTSQAAANKPLELPSFDDYLRARETTRAAIAARVERLETLASTIERNSDPSAISGPLSAALLTARSARNEFESVPNFFARPPHVSGYRASVEERLKQLDVVPLIESLAAIDFQNENFAKAELAKIAQRARMAITSAQPPAASRLAAIRDYFAGYFELLLRGGSLTLYATIIATIFGGMFAVYVKNLGIAERVIYWTAEFAGERPFVIASAVFVVTTTIFTSVGGLGTVIMIGSIVLPVLRSVGLSPVVGAGVLLIGIAAGGTLNPVSRRLWLDFYGLSPEQLDPLLWTMLLIYALLGFGWIAWGARGGLLSSFDSEATAKSPPRESIGAALLLAPVIPVALVYFARMEEISAFVVSIAYMFLCACRRPGTVRVLTRSMIEGAQTVMPPVLLMIGIGMLVTSLATPPVQSYLRPLVESAAPQGRWGYILLFGLAAPLALYRGPLNVWGMGLAVSATLLATTPLPPAAVLGALLAAGMIQGISDPTNTANVWVAGYSGITTAQLLRFTIVPVWIAAIVAVTVFGVWYVP